MEQLRFERDPSSSESVREKHAVAAQSENCGILTPNLYHDFIKMRLRKSDLVLAEVNMTNWIWVEATYGQAVGLEVVQAFKSALTGISNLVTIGAVSTSLYSLASTDITIFAHLLTKIDEAVKSLNREKRWPFNVEIALGAVIATKSTGVEVEEWEGRVRLALVDSIQTRQASIYREDMSVEQRLRTEIGRLTVESRPFDGMHWVFQPIVDVASMRFAGYETLTRWNHPVLGSITPALFIPIAETMGMIHIFDRWALESANEAADLLIQGKELFISVNVSALSLEIDPEFPVVLDNAAELWLERGNKLTIEITESTPLGNAGIMADMFRGLRQKGVLVAIDDFGKGYTSLNMLAELDVDILKIDESVLHLTRECRVNEFMHIAKNLASAIGALTLAEGIESAHELGMVQEFGISLAQGFYLCRPQPAQYFINHDGVCRPSPLVRNELLP